MKNKRLYKLDDKEAKVFGVCGGIAEYFDIDPVIVRVVWAILALAYGTGILAYFIAAIVMPKKSEVVKKSKVVDAKVEEKKSSTKTKKED